MALIRHTTLAISLGAWFWTPEFLSHCLTARSCWMTCTKQPLRRSTCLHRSMSNLIVHPSVTTASGWRGSRPRIEGVFKSSIIITVFIIWRLFIRDLAIIAIIGHWWRRRFRRGWLPIWKVGMNQLKQWTYAAIQLHRRESYQDDAERGAVPLNIMCIILKSIKTYLFSTICIGWAYCDKTCCYSELSVNRFPL